MRATNSIFDDFNSAGDWKISEGNKNNNKTTAPQAVTSISLLLRFLVPHIISKLFV